MEAGSDNTEDTDDDDGGSGGNNKDSTWEEIRAPLVSIAFG